MTLQGRITESSSSFTMQHFKRNFQINEDEGRIVQDCFHCPGSQCLPTQASRFGQQSIFDFSSYEYSVALPPKQVLGKILTFPAKVGWLEPWWQNQFFVYLITDILLSLSNKIRRMQLLVLPERRTATPITQVWRGNTLLFTILNGKEVSSSFLCFKSKTGNFSRYE